MRGGAAPVTDAFRTWSPIRPATWLQTYSRPGQPNQLLLRFEGYVHNRGAGALEVRGSGPAAGRMSSTAQRIYRSDGTWSDDALPRRADGLGGRGRPRPLAR